MKFRTVLLLMAAAALLVTGCGSDSKSDDKDSKPATKAEKERVKDAEAKSENVEKAQKAFDDDKKDVGACRNLGMAWIAKASPASVSDPKEQVVLPEDRDESLKKAVSTLEDCVKIDEGDRDVKLMLSSTYMSMNEPKKATPILRELATSAKGKERPNAFYAWGLAANNAQDYDEAIEAWNGFVKVAPKSDTRVKQVRQSITALRAAAKAQKAAAAQQAKADEGDAEKADDDAEKEDDKD